MIQVSLLMSYNCLLGRGIKESLHLWKELKKTWMHAPSTTLQETFHTFDTLFPIFFSFNFTVKCVWKLSNTFQIQQINHFTDVTFQRVNSKTLQARNWGKLLFNFYLAIISILLKTTEMHSWSFNCFFAQEHDASWTI